MKKTIIQVFPKIKTGGLERGAIDNAILVAEAGFKSIVIAACDDKRLERKLIGAKVQIINLKVGKKNLFHAYKMIKTLKVIFNKLNPHCVHARSRLPIWLCYHALKGSSIPLITSCHGVHDDGLLGLKKSYNRAIVLGQYVIFPSQEMLTHYQERFNFNLLNTHVIPPGIDTSYFATDMIDSEIKIKLNTLWQLNRSKKLILLPGRITNLKGQKALITAICTLPVNIKSTIQVILLGSIENNSYAKECQALIDQLKLRRIINFQPQTPYMREAYALSDIVVSSSIEPESFGRVVCEAMSMQRLVLATNLGGSKNTIIDGQTGFLTEPNPVSLADKLCELLALDDKKCVAIKNNARKHMQESFDLEKSDRKMLKVYEKISRLNN